MTERKWLVVALRSPGLVRLAVFPAPPTTQATIHAPAVDGVIAGGLPLVVPVPVAVVDATSSGVEVSTPRNAKIVPARPSLVAPEFGMSTVVSGEAPMTLYQM